MAVARLQSDFVSAVSHEFRTPLTSLRQFTDMLLDQPTLAEDRRRQVLRSAVARDRPAHAAGRVAARFRPHGSRRRRYRFEPRDCAELVRRVVDDFRRQSAGRPAIDIALHGNGARADRGRRRGAVARASGICWTTPSSTRRRRSVEVGLAATRDGDRRSSPSATSGIGIPADEREAIFRKFQRGEQARTPGHQRDRDRPGHGRRDRRAHHGRV